MSKKALITGITGQDGSYLAEFLLSKGYEVHGIIRRSSSFNTQRIDHFYQHPQMKDRRLFLHYGDLTDSSSINILMGKIKPDEVYNLAAQSHVKLSFDMPEYTGNVSGLGSVRLLDVIAKFNPEIRFYQASSSEMFGSSPPPQSEITPFHPRSPYAVSKVYAYWITVNYRESYDIFCSNGILFNHESPRRGATFVTRKITRGLARILNQTQEKIFLGNIESKRDWGFAPDYIEVMWKMLQQESPDDFVIGTGESHSVKEFLELAFKYLDLDWRDYVKEDDLYLRPAEVNHLQADPTKARKLLNWEPRVNFGNLVKIMVDFDLQSVGIEPPGEGIEFLRENEFFWTNNEISNG